MRRRTAWTAVALLAAALLAWWLLGRSPGTGSGAGRERAHPVGEAPARDEPDAHEGRPSLHGRPDTVLSESTATLEKAPYHKSGDAVLVTGRVVDERRVPVADVEVVADRPGSAVVRTRTDEAGRFELAVPRPPASYWGSVSIVARRGEGEVCSLDLWIGHLRNSPLEVGALVLAPGTRLDVRVEDTDGTPVSAEVLLAEWRGEGRVVARGHTDADGRVRLPAVPDGTWRVLAAVPGRGRGVAMAAVPRESSEPVVLRLARAREVQVLVVAKGTGEPVPDVSVALWENVRDQGADRRSDYLPVRDVPPTDAAGRTRIEDLAVDDEVFLILSTATWAMPLPQGMPGSPFPADHPKVAAAVREVRIELPQPRTVTWPVTDAESPVPVDGTVLIFQPVTWFGRERVVRSARMAGGRIEAADLPPGFVRAFVTTPDGRMAHVFAKAEATEGDEVSFRPGRTVRVRVTYPDGSPATGLEVEVREQGGRWLHDPVALGADGRAVVTGLHGGRADVCVGDGRTLWECPPLGSVDLAAGDGSVEGTVARTRTGILRIRVDGKPRLPARCVVSADNSSLEVVREDPEHGEIHFRWRPHPPGAGSALRLYAPDYLPREELPELSPTAEEPQVVEASLESGATLGVRVRCGPDVRGNLHLECWDAGASRWVRPPRVAVPYSGFGPAGRAHFGPLPEGRYRVVFVPTAQASEAMDVRPGEAPAAIAFDLTATGYARGRVEVPDGYDVRSVRIQATGFPENADESAAQGRGRVGEDGSFRVQVPGTTAITLRPTHEALVPAAEGGEVTVTKPCVGLVLRMVETDCAVFRLEPPLTFPRYDSHPSAAVRLYAPDAPGDPVLSLRAPFSDGLFRFGGFESGTYTLVVDVPGYAPAIRSDVRLVKGRNDLGTIPLVVGSRVVIHLLVPEGRLPPNVLVVAMPVGPPSYRREVSSRGAADVTLQGLGPGRFHLAVVCARDAGSDGLQEKIEVDGEETIERTLDLR